MFDFCIYLSSLAHILELVNMYSFCYGLYIVFFFYFVITVFSQVQLEGVKKLLSHLRERGNLAIVKPLSTYV